LTRAVERSSRRTRRELEGVDVAVVGAPMDELCSDRPGARFGPRGIRAASCSPGPHLEARVGAFERLRIVDYDRRSTADETPGSAR
jgi:arginase family enzyme